MIEYRPDNWVVLRIMDSPPHYKILAGWSGGYASGVSWRMNSGITGVDEIEHAFMFKGFSGSVYTCRKGSYGLRNNNAYVWSQLKDMCGDLIEIMPEDTDWATTEWGIK